MASKKPAIYYILLTQYRYELDLLCLESEVKIIPVLLLMPLYKDSTSPPIHSWALSSDLPPQYLDASSRWVVHNRLGMGIHIIQLVHFFPLQFADGGQWTGLFFDSEHSAY